MTGTSHFSRSKVGKSQTMNARQQRSEMSAELERILDFWLTHGIDETNGGFVAELDNENQVRPDAEKSAILNARILWTFSAALRATGKQEYRKGADRAYAFVCSHFIDREFGGVFWSLHSDGSVANDRKQLYAIAFTIYGLSEYHGATGNAEALELAISLFQDIEKHGFDAGKDGYLEAFARDWSDLDDFRLSDKDENAPKTMNTHLHIMEAYANLYRYWKNEVLERQLRGILEVSLTKILQEDFRFALFFDVDWNPTNRNVSYGHDIEGSWLLQEAAEVLADEALVERVKAIAVKMAEAVYADGVARQGGVKEEFHVGHGVKDTSFHWWPQAEGVVGFYNAFQVSGEQKFLEMALYLWEFTRDHLLDLENGEWFWHVDAEGNALKDNSKVDFWKCPYHNGRACLEIMQRVS